MSELIPTPDRLVEDGHVHSGLFDKPFTDLNILDGPTGMRASMGLHRMRLKEWQHFAFVHPDLYISLAVVDAKFLATSWLYFFDRRRNEGKEHGRKLRPGRFWLPMQLWNEGAEFQARGYKIFIHNHLSAGQHTVTIDIAEKKDLPAIRGELVLTENLDVVQPLIASLPIKPGRPLYTHKAPLPVEGSLRIGGQSYDFIPSRDIALIDVHKAYYPRHTFWRWATFATRSESGSLSGVNLTHNIIKDDHRWNENVIWLEDRLCRVGPARFEIPDNPMAPWRVSTLDKRVDLTLEPVGLRHERINLGLARSSYNQPFGPYSGTLTDEYGRRYGIKGAWGLAEDHKTVW
jgi:hypothetical protein